MWNRSVAFFAAFAALSALLCWTFAGPKAFADSTRDALHLIVAVGPQIALGLLIAGLAFVLMPREHLVRWLGPESGLRGLALATVIGAALPGGPFTSFPLVLAIGKSGADVGAVMTLLVSWAAIGAQRMVIWELPLMGFDFSMVRLLASLPLPIIAGLLTRWLVARRPSLNPFNEGQ